MDAQPAQEMSANVVSEEVMTVSIRLRFVPGMISWVIVVGGALAVSAVIAWWVGRHSIRRERRSRSRAALRDLLLAGALAVVGWFFVTRQFLDLFLDYDLVIECTPPRCSFPSSVQFRTVAEYLAPWMVLIPLAAGLTSRALMPPG